MNAPKRPLILSLIVLITGVCATAEAESGYAATDPNVGMLGLYGMKAGQPLPSNITNRDVSVIHAAGTMRGFKSRPKVLSHCYLSEYLRGKDGICYLRKVI